MLAPGAPLLNGLVGSVIWYRRLRVLVFDGDVWCAQQIRKRLLSAWFVSYRSTHFRNEITTSDLYTIVAFSFPDVNDPV